MLLARIAQCEAEKHVYILLKVKQERETKEIYKMINEEIKIEENKQNKRSNLNAVMSKMDKLKVSVKWNEETVEDVEKTIIKKDEDNEIIKRFSKEDTKKADDLEMKRKRLRDEEISRRQLVTRIANEIENLHLTIGRNLQMYKQMSDERNLMVRQWQDSVKQLHQRNKDTIGVIGEIASIQDLISVNTTTLEEQRQFAENERTNNFELETKINTENANVARLRNRVSNYLQQIQNQTVDLTAVLREFRQAAISLEQQRVEKRCIKTSLIEEKSSLEITNRTVANLQNELQSVLNSNLSAEERFRHLEEIVQNEERNTELLLSEVERMQGVLFRSQSALAEFMETYKIKQLKQKVQENALVTLQRQKIQNEIEIRHSAETLYKLNFRINMLESRLARISGECQDDFSEVHQIRLRELQAVLQSTNEMTNLLQAQLTHLEDDRRRMSISTTADSELLQTLHARLNDRMLMVEGAVKLVAQKRINNNVRKVEQNVLSVRVKSVEKSVKQEGGVIYTLQRQRMELDAAVRERQAEIAVEKDLLLSKKRSLLDDNGRIYGDMQIRKIKIDQLKKRLECILESLGKSEDGETLTATYFRIRNAQEKYALQQEGDRLDRLIRKSEREIVALENTLGLVNNTNKSYKKSLDLIEDQGEEFNNFKNLEEKYKDIGIAMRASSDLLRERSRTIRAMRACVENVRVKYSEISMRVEEKQCRLNEIYTEENDRKSKLNRAMAIASSKECFCEDDNFKDLKVRQLKEINASALQQLLEFSVRYLETEPSLNKYLVENRLTLPPLLSRSSSRTSGPQSVTKSRSSSRSSRTEKLSSATALSTVVFNLNMP